MADPYTDVDNDCMKSIIDFIDKLMKEWRKKRKFINEIPKKLKVSYGINQKVQFKKE